MTEPEHNWDLERFAKRQYETAYPITLWTDPPDFRKPSNHRPKKPKCTRTLSRSLCRRRKIWRQWFDSFQLGSRALRQAPVRNCVSSHPLDRSSRLSEAEQSSAQEAQVYPHTEQKPVPQTLDLETMVRFLPATPEPNGTSSVAQLDRVELRNTIVSHCPAANTRLSAPTARVRARPDRRTGTSQDSETMVRFLPIEAPRYVHWMSKNGDKETLTVTKRLNRRGTRGGGDPRNEGMRECGNLNGLS